MEPNRFINQDTKASDVINNNPLTLLMLDFFDIPLGFKDKTIAQLASANNIDLSAFLAILQLYQGNIPDSSLINSIKDVQCIITFLRKSHRHYVNEQFPVLTGHLNDISKVNSHAEIELLIKFFDEYLDEVSEHLRYEDDIVFPYVMGLINKKNDLFPSFSIDEYRKHHDDIEEKLTDLKNLLIRYLPAQNDTIPRRKLLFALNDFESDLHIHSLIEEKILIPLVEKLEVAHNSIK